MDLAHFGNIQKFIKKNTPNIFDSFTQKELSLLKGQTDRRKYFFPEWFENKETFRTTV